MSHVPYASVVINLMYIRNFTCSGSIEKVYVKTMEGALYKSEAFSLVFVWN